MGSLFKKSRIRQRFATFAALFAIMLHAIAPVVAHATMAKAGTSWIALCTAHGMVQIQVATDVLGATAPDQPLKIKSVQPCALCTIAATAMPLPIGFFTFNFSFNALTNALFVSLGSSSFVFASVVQHHAPPTGPPFIFFV